MSGQEPEPTHVGAGEADLENALENLSPGERVFITSEDYVTHHSPDGEPLDEFNSQGEHGQILREIADAYGCDLFNDLESGRVFFFKKPEQNAT